MSAPKFLPTLTEQLDDIRVTLFHARLCSELWRTLNLEHPQRKRIVYTFNRYVSFFEAVTPALWVTFVVKLASLFGTSADEITLANIQEFKVQPVYNDIWERGRRLYRLRSKEIAHRDSQVGSENYAQQSGFTYNDLKTLIDDTCALFDSVVQPLGFDGIPKVTCADDLLAIVFELSRDFCNEDQTQSR